ncbi:phosphotransferase family protein [Ktedonospora formicarum]|uniref:Aminoglycoside phosphotransferase domain-containing protein n=1 Tax=Ktedonospora formicarum TaxID=2778364 RepID=A0A8J3MTI7_9CHLR|nr:phosphotransferase [Ktedonospora formicarum]GHO45971.1 hypothetical protein KSX_41340 [Ktedonospora formicarum]
MTETSSLNDWLQTKHNQWKTPDSVIHDYVRRATGSAITQSSRVVLGQDNEVYDVTTTDHHQIIVRISRKANHRFATERWALNAARLAGVPTPRVLLVEQAEYDEANIMFCIEEKVPGRPLDVLLKEARTSNVNKAINQIGEILGRLHSVNIGGFGYLQANAKGQQTSFAEIMLMANEREAELYEAAAHWHIPTQKITTSLEILDTHRELYKFTSPVLVHGDFGPQHIFVEGDHISGIIDMQDCSGNHPIIDFVNWDAYYCELVPTSKLMASYGNQEIFMGNYKPLFRLVLLREALIMLMVNAAHQNPHGVSGFIAEMERALKYFANAR